MAVAVWIIAGIMIAVFALPILVITFLALWWLWIPVALGIILGVRKGMQDKKSGYVDPLAAKIIENLRATHESRMGEQNRKV